MPERSTLERLRVEKGKENVPPGKDKVLGKSPSPHKESSDRFAHTQQGGNPLTQRKRRLCNLINVSKLGGPARASRAEARFLEEDEETATQPDQDSAKPSGKGEHVTEDDNTQGSVNTLGARTSSRGPLFRLLEDDDAAGKSTGNHRPAPPSPTDSVRSGSDGGRGSMGLLASLRETRAARALPRTSTTQASPASLSVTSSRRAPLSLSAALTLPDSPTSNSSNSSVRSISSNRGLLLSAQQNLSASATPAPSSTVASLASVAGVHTNLKSRLSSSLTTTPSTHSSVSFSISPVSSVSSTPQASPPSLAEQPDTPVVSMKTPHGSVSISASLPSLPSSSPTLPSSSPVIATLPSSSPVNATTLPSTTVPTPLPSKSTTFPSTTLPTPSPVALTSTQTTASTSSTLSSLPVLESIPLAPPSTPAPVVPSPPSSTLPSAPPSSSLPSSTTLPSSTPAAVPPPSSHPHSVPTSSSSASKSHRKEEAHVVNGKVYFVLELIGQGGSSKVYRVLSKDKKVFALKKIAIGGEANHVANYHNEIALLQRLKGRPYVIQLVDAQEDIAAGVIYMLFELGTMDLAHFLQINQTSKTWDNNSIRYYWKQILECTQMCHDEKIIHLDLKPPNFVLVDGCLKLIDFGIAKEVAADATSILNESNIGTLDYMSPESVVEHTAGSVHGHKLGRSTDVWSLGCILYQMVYGFPPLRKFSMVQKMRALMDPNFVIAFGPCEDSALLQVMKACLKYNPKDRPTIAELLCHPYLAPKQEVVNAQHIESILAQLGVADSARIAKGVVAQIIAGQPVDLSKLT